MPEAAKSVEEEVVVSPFGVEVDHPRNDTLLLQSVPGMKLRSAVDGSKPYAAADGESYVPIDQVQHLASFPKTPGVQLHVNPAKLTYVVQDPLNEDEPTLEKIKKFLSNHGRRVDKVKGIETTRGKLDVHRMKTLCREIRDLFEEGHVKPVKGDVPSRIEIDELPGHFLLNPGSRVQNTQPMFEKDFDSWVENISRVGG